MKIGNIEIKLGTHKEKCPHCLGGLCECQCSECRPELWENGILKENYKDYL
jgi:hypothetical protein